MIRLVGAVLLTSGSAALGLGAAAHLDGRVRDLKGLIAGLEAMKRALSASMEPLSQMLRAAAQSVQGRPKEFFQFCQQGASCPGEDGFAAVWAAALEAVPLRLEEQDLLELKPLEGVLGRFDGDSQLAALDRTAAQLAVRLEEAEEQRRRLGKVYGALGVTSGLFLAILLI